MFAAAIFGLSLASAPHLFSAVQKDKEKDLKDIKRQLEGVWIVTAEMFNGSEAARDELKGLSVFVKGNTITFRGSTVRGEATWTVDTSKNPCHIDITFTSEPLKGEKKLGILKLDGDAMTLCVDASGKGRPDRFESPAGSEYMLHVHRRDKKEK